VQVFGVMGLFIGPVILSVAAALLSMVYEDFAAPARARADTAAD
jgi:predicted PurR-regulated permease PerM